MFFFLLGNQSATAQITCDMMALSVSSSDTGYVQLYHPGAYLLWPRDPNVIEFAITDVQGNLIHQDTIYGSNGLMLFNHNIPVTDTMNVQSIIRNDSLGIVCLIEDKLYWKITQVLPGSSFGNWEILNSNTGSDITTVRDMGKEAQNIVIFSSPGSDLIQISAPELNHYIDIFNLQGQYIRSTSERMGSSTLDVSNLENGLYILNFRFKEKGTAIKFVKQ